MLFTRFIALSCRRASLYRRKGLLSSAVTQGRALVLWLAGWGLLFAMPGDVAFALEEVPTAPPAFFVPAPRPIGWPSGFTLTPYNTGYQAINLWRIEATRFVRTPPILSPNAQQYVYSEVVYLPGTRQVWSSLYRVILPSWAGLPSGQSQIQVLQQGLSAQAMVQQRQLLLRAGDTNPKGYQFDTLTLVDWSADGTRLLVERKSGILYTGLRTSDVWVVDLATTGQRQATWYGELMQAVRYYWQQQAAGQPELFQRAWQIQVLGWEPGSNTSLVYQARAYSQKAPPVFLGTWRFDTTTHSPQLLSLNGEERVPVAANGWLATPPSPASSLPAQSPKWRFWQRKP